MVHSSPSLAVKSAAALGKSLTDRPEKGEYVRPVRSLDELMTVFAIRTAAFVSEQESPWAEEFDGNDFSAQHFIAFVDGEPAGAMRIRYFADFAKPERLAVLPKYRKQGRIAFKLVREGMAVARQKGYTTFYGHAMTHLVRFWSRFGFEPIDEPEARFVYSDQEYVAMRAELGPLPDAVRLLPPIDHMRIVRTEGAFDEPGVMEYSTTRPAANRGEARRGRPTQD